METQQQIMLQCFFKTLWTKYYTRLNGQALVLSPVFAHSLTANSSSQKLGRGIGDILQELTTTKMINFCDLYISS